MLGHGGRRVHHHTGAFTVRLDSDADYIGQFIARLAALVVVGGPVRAQVDACDERRASVVALPVVPQPAHSGILADTLDGILLDNLADGLGQKEASRFKSLVRMPMVQLKDLVEGLFSDLAHTLTKSPLIERFFRHRALLNLFHVV